MHSLQGKNVEKPPYQELRLIRDLSWYDGPLSSLYRDKDGKYIISLWRATDQETFHRWMIFQISKKQLHLYLRKKTISLLSLIENSPDGFVYFEDVNSELDTINCVEVKVSEIPDIYLPKENSTYRDIPLPFEADVSIYEKLEDYFAYLSVSLLFLTILYFHKYQFLFFF